jgi:opacity protein-like surface antigen
MWISKFLIAIFLLLCLIVNGQLTDTLPKQKIPAIKWNGGIGLGTQWYHANNLDSRMVSPMWNISGNASVSIYDKISLPFSFTLGRQGSSSSIPSFNQIGFSPKYKSITVHAGWRRVHFSDFTLGDHTFMGTGIEFKPGKLRFAAINGRFRKARDYDSEQINTSVNAVLKRTGFSVKLGYGTESTFFDLIYFKAKDDISSLKLFPPDSLLTASENAVIGFNIKLSLGPGFSFFAEGALSAFTRDITSTLSDTGYFQRIQEKILKPRSSTRANYAFKSGLETGTKNLRLRLQYERIAPEYETMGSFFFLNDLENITIAPNISLFNHKLRLNGYAGIQRNNLLNNRSETTKRFIGVGNISLQATEVFGIDFNFNSVNINQEQANIRFSDTIRVAMITTHYSLNPRWLWIRDTSMIKALTMSANYQELNDRNPFTREFTNMSTWFLNANYSINTPVSGFTWFGGLNFNIIQLATLNTTRYGATLGAEKSTKSQIWLLSGSTTYNLSNLDTVRDGSVISINSSIRFAPRPKHAFILSANVLRTNSSAFDDFTEIIAGLHYNYIFR